MTDDLVKRLRDFDPHLHEWEVVDQAADRIDALTAERDALQADNAWLRKSCECAMSEIKDYMQEVGETLPLALAMGWLSAALNTGKEVMPDDAQYNQPADIGPGNQAVAGAALPTVDELAQIIRIVDGNHNLGAGELAERILSALAQKGDSHE